MLTDKVVHTIHSATVLAAVPFSQSHAYPHTLCVCVIGIKAQIDDVWKLSASVRLAVQYAMR
jgi:hypothetical protein